MEGGYLMINLADNELFQRLQIGKDLGKPILVRDGNQNFFIDRITGGSPIYDEDDILTGYSDIVLLSANGSITITDANVVTKTDLDNVIYPLMENIKDASGNLRFIEGAGVNSEISGVTITYSKWSLSGTHLMLVLAGTIANATSLADGNTFVEYEIPEWIADKIYTVWGETNIEVKNINVYNQNWTFQAMSFNIRKTATKTLLIRNIGGFTATAERSFRIQFDLLIDNEDGE